ncbi:hypothetical protein ACVWWK_001571 [Bradyrhizobium sp. LB9.1b]
MAIQGFSKIYCCPSISRISCLDSLDRIQAFYIALRRTRTAQNYIISLIVKFGAPVSVASETRRA